MARGRRAFLGRARRRLSAEIRGRRQLRRRLGEVAGLVVPGIWVATARDRAVRLQRGWWHAGGLSGRGRDAVAAVGLAPWSFARVGARVAAAPDTDREYTRLVVGAKDTILVAEGRHVLRLSSERKVADDAHVRARSALGEVLATPRWEVQAAGRAIREEFVDGPLVATLSGDEQRAACREVLAVCRAIARDHARGPATALATAALDRVVALADGVPAALAQGARQMLAVDHVAGRDGPLVPAHADLKPTNLIRRGTEVVAIDLEYASFQPFHFDTLNLVANMVSSDLVGPDEVLEALEAVHVATGQPHDTDQLRWSLVSFAALRTYRYVLRGLLVDDEAHARSLTWSWRLVAPAHARL